MALEAELWDGIGWLEEAEQMAHDVLADYRRSVADAGRREVRLLKAHNVLKRYHRVRQMDLHAMTSHIGPDFFGEKHLQFKEVRRLGEKRARLLWYLLGKYRYLAFGHEVNGFRRRWVKSYSRFRVFWYERLDAMREAERQRKWDAKRARVRKRRKGDTKRDAQVEILYKLRHGIGDKPPV